MSRTGPIVQPWNAGATPSLGVPPPRRRWPWAVAPLLVVVLIVVVAGFAVNTSYYALAPGTALPVNDLIAFPPGKGKPIRGQVLLTDVSISQVKLIEVIPDALDANMTLQSGDELLQGASPEQFQRQNQLAMADSKQAAEVAAFRQLGYTVPEQDVGAQVQAVAPGSPAVGRLSVGDLIMAVDGRSTPTDAAVVAAVRSAKVGQLVTLAVQPASGQAHQVQVALGQQQTNGQEVPFIGVVLSTKSKVSLPFKVELSSDGIGGPSAGLAFSLGIVDALTTGDITGGKTIAATGTISSDGEVGDVGGIAQKTVAVQNAGATVFLVPAQEVHVAQAHAKKGLQVIAVSSLSQALVDLSKMGSRIGNLRPALQGSSAAS